MLCPRFHKIPADARGSIVWPVHEVVSILQRLLFLLPVSCIADFLPAVEVSGGGDRLAGEGVLQAGGAEKAGPFPLLPRALLCNTGEAPLLVSCLFISLRQRVALHREKFAAIAEQAGRRNKRAAGNAGLILPLSPGEHITAVTLALKIRHDAVAVRALMKTLHFHAILPLFFVFMGYYHKIT